MLHGRAFRGKYHWSEIMVLCLRCKHIVSCVNTNTDDEYEIFMTYRCPRCGLEFDAVYAFSGYRDMDGRGIDYDDVRDR
jgi:hypothetical protein